MNETKQGTRAKCAGRFEAKEPSVPEDLRGELWGPSTGFVWNPYQATGPRKQSRALTPQKTFKPVGLRPRQFMDMGTARKNRTEPYGSLFCYSDLETESQETC